MDENEEGEIDGLEGLDASWSNPAFGSFDDFNQAMLLLFVMSTGDDWDQIMFWAMDSSGPNLPRVRNDSSAVCIFFVVWTFVGCFFAMQLFVGVVVEQFNSMRAKRDGSATMTDEQRQWVEAQRTMGHTKVKVKPKLRPNAVLFDQALFHIVSSAFFQRWVTGALVVANVNAVSSR